MRHDYWCARVLTTLAHDLGAGSSQVDVGSDLRSGREKSRKTRLSSPRAELHSHMSQYSSLRQFDAVLDEMQRHQAHSYDLGSDRTDRFVETAHVLVELVVLVGSERQRRKS